MNAEFKIEGVSNKGKAKLIFFLAETFEVDNPMVHREGAICVISNDIQIDFDLSEADIDMLIGYLKGMRKHITVK